MPKDFKEQLEDQVTQDQGEHPAQQDSQDTKVWVVKWDQKEDLVLQEVLDQLDQEDERVMLGHQDLVVDLVLLDPQERTVFKEPWDQLVHQVSEEKMEKQELLVLLESSE